jgi:hypothetical protein
LFQAVVLFFAIYAFAFVPLGHKTALEHVLAIARTPAAHQAASEVGDGVTRLVKRLRSDAERKTQSPDEDAPESAPEPPPMVPEPAPPVRPLHAAEPPPSGPKPAHKSPQRLGPHDDPGTSSSLLGIQPPAAAVRH